MRCKKEALTEFKKLAKDPVGKIYVDRFEDNIRVLIMRGPASLCAYLGIPEAHPLAGTDYDDLSITCNGGLTYSSGAIGKGLMKADKPEKSLWPEGYYWYGWDHAHCDDLCFYDLDSSSLATYKQHSKAWTVKDVEDEIWNAVCDLKESNENSRRC